VTQKIKILLVEDDQAIREMYTLKFQAEGLTIFVAEDGVEALEVARKIKPDILLLDIKIPFIGGLEVFENLLREDWAPQMQVIVLTNISYNEAPDLLKSDRITEYVVKAHHTPKEVLAITKKLINKPFDNNVGSDRI